MNSLFVSYSHTDEKFKNEFVTHLSPLERSGQISTWTDRELIAGDRIDEEILQNLKSADIVVFLISADFIKSYYCYEKEMAEALEIEKNKKNRVIPVIVRACSWEDTPLAKFVAGTLDANPIAQFQDRDQAWLNVVREIKKNITNRLPTMQKDSDIDFHWKLTEYYENQLSSDALSFQHRVKESVQLQDVFVYPDIRRSISSYGEIEDFVCASKLASQITSGTQQLLTGDEQSGKTTLARQLFKDFLQSGHLPLLLKGDQITSAQFEKFISKQLAEQYEGATLSTYSGTLQKKILIVDDFHLVRLNKKFLGRFVENTKHYFDVTLLFADSLANHDDKFATETASMTKWTIEPLGNVKRGKLIEKWVTLGQEDTIEDKHRILLIDQATQHVNSIVRKKNILPAKPLYILTILQFLDTGASSDIALTSYGHCYQVLIQQQLRSAGVSHKDIDGYYNYLGELAFFMFKKENSALTTAEYERFKSSYSDKFIIRSHDVFMANLVSSNLLKSDGSLLQFSYRYIFYFYVAKYLAENLDLAGEIVSTLCTNIHTERNANILIFLVHHSRNQTILDELLSQASETFGAELPALLDIDQTGYMIKFISEVPSLVLENRDIDKERRKELQRKDDMERADGVDEDEFEENINTTVAEINRSYRIIDVVGQMLRNRVGSLTKPQIHDLADAAYGSGLRFLTFWLTAVENDHDSIVEQIEQMIGDEKDLDDSDVKKVSRRFVLGISYGMCLAVIKKLANSVGSQELLEMVTQLSEEEPTSISRKLIRLSAQLEFAKSLPKRELENLYEELRVNPIAQRLLVEIVVDYQYLNPVNFKDRQWISDKLKIPLKIQQQSRLRGRTK